MNSYTFTDRVRIVLQMAREEAADLHHEYVGPEHLLMGLIQEGQGVAMAVLTNLNVDPEKIQQEIKEIVKPGKASAGVGPDLPYTSRAKKVLDLARSETREMNFDYVGTEHLLLGLLREEKGIAAQVLTGTGLTVKAVRTETLRLLAGQQVGGSRKTGVSGERDQRFKTAIALIELHRVRFGSFTRESATISTPKELKVVKRIAGSAVSVREPERPLPGRET